MKLEKWILLAFVLFLSGCKKEEILDISLNKKWQVYVVAVVAISDTNYQTPCLYDTKESDLYYDPIGSRCDSDDVYDFTKPESVKINYGEKRCFWNQPASITYSYERKGDSLFFNGLKYNIVSLTNDTLILDQCSEFTASQGTIAINKAKLATKLVRID